MGKIIDLTGQKFGKLTVIRRDGLINEQKAWLCTCECGNIVRVRSYSLRSGETKSCGCYAKEQLGERTRKKTKYIIDGDTAICYTQKGEAFYVDAEDAEKIANNAWHITPKGYVAKGKSGGGQVFLHRVIFGDLMEKEEVDHIDRNKLNNKKSNLRACMRCDNGKNKGITKSNTSGFPGVDFKNGKWRVRIGCNNKSIHVGYFSNYADAVAARCKAVKEYFGEFAPSYVPAYEIDGVYFSVPRG